MSVSFFLQNSILLAVLVSVSAYHQNIIRAIITITSAIGQYKASISKSRFQSNHFSSSSFCNSFFIDVVVGVSVRKDTAETTEMDEKLTLTDYLLVIKFCPHRREFHGVAIENNVGAPWIFAEPDGILMFG